MRLSTKLVLISEAVLLLSIVALLVPAHWAMRAQIVEDMQRELKAIAGTAALSLDGDLHRQVAEAGVAEGAAFEQLRDELIRVRNTNRLPPEQIYTFYPDPVDTEVVRFGVMTHTNPFVGDPYPIRPEIRHVLGCGEVISSPLYRDDHGQWISGYAPIRDSTNAVVGVLEVDRDASEYFRRHEEMTLWLLIMGVGALGLSSVTGLVVLDRVVLRPIKALHDGMRALAQQDFSHRVKLATRDEFSDLGATLNQMSQQLNVARTIQAGFFPRQLPQQAGWCVAASSASSDATGGDYVDAFPLPDGRMMVLVADVSGHGLGPSLLMAACRSSLRALSMTGLSVDELVDRLDRLLEDDLSGRFITLIVGVCSADGSFEYVNAGHGPAIVVSDGKLVHLPPQRLPLGVGAGLGDIHREPAQRLRLSTGDRIFLATDGLTEAMDPQGNMPEREALEAMVSDASLSGKDLLARLDAFLHQHRRGRTASDDVTMLCVDRVMPDDTSGDLQKRGARAAPLRVAQPAAL